MYPLLVHLAVLRHSALLAGLALFLLALVTLYAPLAAGRRGAWLALLGIAALLVLLPVGGTSWLLYLPPIAFPLVILASFAVSLLPGRTPLVSAIAARVHGLLPPALAAYTRRVTWLWTLVIAGMLAVNLELSFGGSREAWSLFTNGGDYLLLVSVFLLEYLWRRARFRGLPEPSFADYLRLVLRHRPGIA
ncbi:MAG: hypothetical protein NVS9B10_21380 [Nevskia sp.]